TNDQVTLSAGGAIEGAGTNSSLTATLNNNVVTNSAAGAPDAFTTNQDIGIGTYTTVDAGTRSSGSTVGLRAVADAIASTTVTSNQPVTLGPSTNLAALHNITPTAGDNPIPGEMIAEPMVGDSNAQSYARGFIGIPAASATSTLTSNAALVAGANDQILSGEN